MSRFAPLPNPGPESRFANLGERIRGDLPQGTSSRLLAHRVANGTELTAVERVNAERAGLLPRNKTSASAAPSAPAPAKPKAVAPVAPTITSAQAAAKGAQEAIERRRAVMASDPVKGREKQAGELLMASCDRNAKHKTATEIIAELKKRPSDAEVAEATKARTAAESDAIWSRAIASANGALPALNVDQKSDDVWSRAIAAVNGEPRKLGANASARDIEIDQLWTRAISAVKVQGARA